MSILKNTKLSLKQIVENLDKIPSSTGFDDEPKKLTPEQKKRLMEMASQFEKFGEVFRNEAAILESTKSMTELCELASNYAVNECADCFQKSIIDKDFSNVKKRMTEHTKIAKECYAKMQQLRVAHEDIGSTLSRYFNLKEIVESMGFTQSSATTVAGTPQTPLEIGSAPQVMERKK
jgi:hypothetical protein